MENLDSKAKYRRKNRTELCQKSREYYEKNREREKERFKKYQKTRSVITKRDPIKRRTYDILHYALKMGRLQKKPCGECGAEKVEAHHEDYARPLAVTWLCKKCHAKHHRVNNHAKGEPSKV